MCLYLLYMLILYLCAYIIFMCLYLLYVLILYYLYVLIFTLCAYIILSSCAYIYFMFISYICVFLFCALYLKSVGSSLHKGTQSNSTTTASCRQYPYKLQIAGHHKPSIQHFNHLLTRYFLNTVLIQIS